MADVASFMGAWIETGISINDFRNVNVASFMGAWIETSGQTEMRFSDKSHPLWVRGLKLMVRLVFFATRRVASFMGAWIETTYLKSKDYETVSHPLWVRGLKRCGASVNCHR